MPSAAGLVPSPCGGGPGRLPGSVDTPISFESGRAALGVAGETSTCP